MTQNSDSAPSRDRIGVGTDFVQAAFKLGFLCVEWFLIGLVIGYLIWGR